MKENTEKNTEKQFVVALPLRLNLTEYSLERKIGGTIADSPEKAVRNFLFRNNPNRTRARIILHILKRDYGGYGNCAFEVPEVFQTPEDLKKGTGMNEFERRLFQETALAYELERHYSQKNHLNYLSTSRKILQEFDELKIGNSLAF
jgi:hypothetical protein